MPDDRGTEVAMTLSEEVLRQAALACFENAQQLCTEATLLLEHGHRSRAVALAIIGCEEFAKAVAHTLGALLPEQRAEFHANLTELHRGHDVKHLITDLADAAQIENSEGWHVAASEVRHWPSADQRLADMFISLAEWGIDKLILSRRAAKEEYRRRDQDLNSVRIQ